MGKRGGEQERKGDDERKERERGKFNVLSNMGCVKF